MKGKWLLLNSIEWYASYLHLFSFGLKSTIMNFKNPKFLKIRCKYAETFKKTVSLKI
jgi:hypothetical protein